MGKLDLAPFAQNVNIDCLASPVRYQDKMNHITQPTGGKQIVAAAIAAQRSDWNGDVPWRATISRSQNTIAKLLLRRCRLSFVRKVASWLPVDNV